MPLPQKTIQKLHKMRILSLTGQYLTNEDIKDLAIRLSDNHTLQELDLGWNTIDCIGLSALAAILPSTNIRTLKLDGNYIRDTGATELFLILPNTRITSLSIADNALTYASIKHVCPFACIPGHSVNVSDNLLNPDAIKLLAFLYTDDGLFHENNTGFSEAHIRSDVVAGIQQPFITPRTPGRDISHFYGNTLVIRSEAHGTDEVTNYSPANCYFLGPNDPDSGPASISSDSQCDFRQPISSEAIPNNRFRSIIMQDVPFSMFMAPKFSMDSTTSSVVNTTWEQNEGTFFNLTRMLSTAGHVTIKAHNTFAYEMPSEPLGPVLADMACQYGFKSARCDAKVIQLFKYSFSEDDQDATPPPEEVKQIDFSTFFPDEIIAEIFQHLDYRHLMTAASVSRNWQRVATDGLLQKKSFFKAWGKEGEQFGNFFTNRFCTQLLRDFNITPKTLPNYYTKITELMLAFPSRYAFDEAIKSFKDQMHDNLKSPEEIYNLLIKRLKSYDVRARTVPSA